MKKILIPLLSCCLGASFALVGCSGAAESANSEQAAERALQPAVEQTSTVTEALENSFDFSLSERDEDASYDESSAARITFSSNGQVETITEEGTYILSGTSEGGQLIVDLTNSADPENAKVQLVLDNLTLTNTAAPALLVTQADKVFLTLAEGSENTLSDGSGRTDVPAASEEDASSDSSTTSTSATEEDSENATLYSHDDLTINGSGGLTVKSEENHAIKVQDDLVIADGKLSVSAGGDGIRGKDCIKIAAGTISVEAADDGIVSTQTNAPTEQGFVNITGGEIIVDATDDGIKGESLVRLAGGSVAVAASTEGIEACLVWIEDGEHAITSTDDALNAAGDIRSDYHLNITGGTLLIDCEGDGLDSNNIITQSGGTVVVAGPTKQGNGAMDAEYSATTTGGTLLALDSSGMGTTYASDSTQSALLYSAPQVQAAGTRISLVDNEGSVLFSYVSPKQFSTLAYSSPELTEGESYHFVVGGTINSGSMEQPSGFTQGGTLSGGETLTSFTLSEQLAQISASGEVQVYNGQMMMGSRGGRG